MAPLQHCRAATSQQYCRQGCNTEALVRTVSLRLRSTPPLLHGSYSPLEKTMLLAPAPAVPQWVLEGHSGVLDGYSSGPLAVLKRYSRGTQAVLLRE
jgi:hypothetical protein